MLGFAVPGHSNIADEVHRSLVREHYDQALAQGKAAMAAAQGDTSAAKQQRLRVLNLLLDVESLHSDAEGAQWADQVLALELELHGENSRGQIKALTYLAVHDLMRQKFRDGLQQIERAQSLAEHGEGALADVDRAYMLKEAAWFEHRRGNMAQAVALAEQSAQAVQSQRDDWQRIRYVNSLWILATYENMTGRGDIALVNARKALELATRLSGQDSVLREHCLYGLGEILYFQGDYLEARRIQQEALSVARHHTDSPGFMGDTLDALAATLRTLGEIEPARKLFDESLELAQRTNQGKFGIIVRMNNLAELERDAGKDEQAREWFQKILALEGSPGTSNPHMYLPLFNLGAMALHAGDIDGAADYYARAQRVLGDTMDVNGQGAEIRQALAEIALARGQPGEAENLLAAAQANLAQGYGENSPLFSRIRCDLALAKARQNKLEEAFALAATSEGERVQLLNRVVPALGEGQALRFKSTLDSCQGLMLALAASAQKPEWTGTAWGLAAEARGLATRLEMTRLAAARASASAATRMRLNEWENAARNYANALVQATESQNADASRHRLDEAEAALGSDPSWRALVRDIAAPPKDAWRERFEHHTVIAYIKSDNVDIGANAHSRQSAGEHLYAFVRVQGATPRAFDLGSAAEIEALSARWYSLLRRADSDAAGLQQAGIAVRQRLWDPLGLKAAERVFVINDGPTFRLNFAALPDGDGFLIERGWRFHTLETEYDAARLAGAEPHREKLLLVGAIDYGSTTDVVATRDGSHCRKPYFEQLPGTVRELDQLSALWKTGKGDRVTVLRGSAVDDATLRRSTPRADIVHFATHAFDLGGDCAAAAGTRGVQLDAEDGLRPDAAGKLSHEAALALSDANANLASGAGAGLLTPEKIVTYPLADVSWVILAACDTGLGNVVGDEGVFGLRRAFRIAGAHTVVMSLWAIEDSATTGWMTALYHARLEGQDTIDAMASAQLAALTERREHSLSVHPYFWAGFVAAGDWR